MAEKICVIVPVKFMHPYFNKSVESFLSLEYPNFELIMVDDDLTAEGRRILEEYQQRFGFKILDSGGRGPSHSRNLAAGETDAKFIAFTDSDCVAAKDWLTQLVLGLEKYPEAVSCGGRQELPPNSTFFEKKVYLFIKKAGIVSDYIRSVKNDKIIQVNHNPSCNVIYKRDIFLEEGGFLEGLWPGEDVELDHRLKTKGYQIIFNPKAIVYHYRSKNFKIFFKMAYRYGYAQGALVRKYGLFRRLQIIPILSALFLLAIFLLLWENLCFFLLLLLILGLSFFGFDICVFSLAAAALIFWNSGFLKGYFSAKK